MLMSLARFAVSLLLASLALCAARVASAQTSFVTYQGKLLQGGQPVTTSMDFNFRVFTAQSGGTLVGNATAAWGVVPVDGVFSAQLFLNQSNYTGADRWLEVECRPSGSGQAFTVLTPRQRLAPTPYAMRSLSERWTDTSTGVLSNDSVRTPKVFINRTSGVTNAEYFGITTPTGQQAYGGMYIDTAAGDGFPFYGYSTGGTVRAYSFVDGSNGTWTLFNNGSHVNLSALGRVGIGTQPNGIDKVQIAGSVNATSTVKALEFAYNTTQSRVLNLSGEDFRAADSSQPGSFGRATTWEARLDASVTFGEIVAGVHLPEGAVLTGMHFYATSGGGPPYVTCTLRRRPVGGLVYDVLMDATTNGIVGQFDEATLAPLASLPIDNFNYVYVITIGCNDWNNSTKVNCVRIFYNVPKAD